MTTVNHFRDWCIRLGFNEKKQLSVAGELLGMERRTASKTANGHRELTQVERLAMSAIRAGLQPWTPGYDPVLTSAASGNQTASAAQDSPAADTQG